MACLTTGFWCSSNVKIALFPAMSSPRISCRSTPIPPLNPRDPFLSKLVSVATSENPETPPHLNLFENPKIMDNPDQVESAVMYNEHRPREHPPDLRSFLLRGRIVYIGMPLVEDVVELVTAELLYLQQMDPNQPIYLYINSSGMIHHDVVMIQTVAVGAAIGQACLLLAAGKKGRRFMFPHARVLIRHPIFSHGEMQTSDIFLHTKQALKNRETLEILLARHTGRPIKEVISMMRKPFFMSSTEARDFGFVDKILCCGQEEQIEKMNPPEDQDRKAGIETVDGM